MREFLFRAKVITVNIVMVALYIVTVLSPLLFLGYPILQQVRDIGGYAGPVDVPWQSGWFTVVNGPESLDVRAEARLVKGASVDVFDRDQQTFVYLDQVQYRDNGTVDEVTICFLQQVANQNFWLSHCPEVEVDNPDHLTGDISDVDLRLTESGVLYYEFQEKWGKNTNIRIGALILLIALITLAFRLYFVDIMHFDPPEVTNLRDIDFPDDDDRI